MQCQGINFQFDSRDVTNTRPKDLSNFKDAVITLPSNRDDGLDGLFDDGTHTDLFRDHQGKFHSSMNFHGRAIRSDSPYLPIPESKELNSRIISAGGDSRADHFSQRFVSTDQVLDKLKLDLSRASCQVNADKIQMHT